MSQQRATESIFRKIDNGCYNFYFCPLLMVYQDSNTVRFIHHRDGRNQSFYELEFTQGSPRLTERVQQQRQEAAIGPGSIRQPPWHPCEYAHCRDEQGARRRLESTP